MFWDYLAYSPEKREPMSTTHRAGFDESKCRQPSAERPSYTKPSASGAAAGRGGTDMHMTKADPGIRTQNLSFTKAVLYR